MNSVIKTAAAALMLHGLFEVSAAAAQTAAAENCPFGRTIKVAVYQGGSYIDFQKLIRQTVNALAADGYISLKDGALPDDFTFDAGDSYSQLAQSTQGSCIELLPDGLYNGSWQDDKVQSQADALKQRITQKGDVDMIWALGTLGGQLFADSSLGIPVLVMTASDPESTGIIGPGEFSNKPNVHVQKEIGRTRNELTMFYNIFKFKRLGIIIDDDPENWAGQSLPAIEAVSKELGFTLERCIGPVIDPDVKKAQAAYSKCAADLAERTDAVYLSLGSGSSPTRFFWQIKPIIDKKIPTFSQTGGSEVERGALLSLSDMDLAESGAFEAQVIEQIYQGKKPEEISQYYYAPLALNLNLQTARLIEWKPDFEILMAIDQVFQTIDLPDDRPAVN